MSSPTFGLSLRDAPTIDAALDLEASASKREAFDDVETVLAGLAIRAARGEVVVRIRPGDDLDRVEVLGIPDQLRGALDATFRLEAQQARGAWFLPETVAVRASAVNLPSYFRQLAPHAHTLAWEDRGRVALSGSPEAMVLWAAIEPMFAVLFAPIVLRAERAGKLERDAFTEEWEESASALGSLGLSLERFLPVLAWGGGWSRLRPDERVELQRGFIAAVSEQMGLPLIRRYRIFLIRRLTAKYYAKAKKGRATRKQVVTKELAPILAAFFGGDWLSYIAYLGEEPADDERIVTALPESKLFVAGKSRAAEMAAKKGLPLEEVERMLASVWQSSDGESPVARRVEVLAKWWTEFDAVHARQATGDAALWGLVDEGSWSSIDPDLKGPQPGLFRRLLSPALVGDVDRLWSTTVVDRYAERVVTAPFPHALAADTLGPALRFWHGCALTAWFVCEGPSSRTDIPGLAHYYRRELGEMETLGFGVHGSLFEELSAVQLGPEEPLRTSSSSIDVGHGFSVQMVTSSGSRRRGFELLRDVITRHRQWWARNLDGYLRALWEQELKAVARQFHLMSEEKGKPPTFKQFAKHLAEPARAWFGGDVSLVYAAIGQKCPVVVERRASIASDGFRFATELFRELGGRHVERGPVESQEARDAQSKAWEIERNTRKLASEGFWFVQLDEALGRPPTPKEFGFNFEWYGKSLAETEDEAWTKYSDAVLRVRERARVGAR